MEGAAHTYPFPETLDFTVTFPLKLHGDVKSTHRIISSAGETDDRRRAKSSGIASQTRLLHQ